MAQLSRDLADVAVLGYITDDLDGRASAPDRWTRSHHFQFPVRKALWWQATPVLAEALNRVAGDNFSFASFERSAVPVKKHRIRSLRPETRSRMSSREP
jgi:hypothetical protein